MPRSFRLIAPVVSAVCTIGAITVASTPSASALHAPGMAGATTTPSAPVSERRARAVLDGMTLRQKVGQLFMVGTPAIGPNAATLADITERHIGNVMLTGRSYGGTATPLRAARAAQARATAAATDKVKLLVATDQEGGLVQVLHGNGFSQMPSELAQGRERPSALEKNAGVWAGQLLRAGVNMDLAPVVDTVPGPGAASSNPPIGALDREFGFRPGLVANHGRAFVTGMSTHGVVPTVKHFPGLGRVHANTDTSAGVTDYVTTRHGDDLKAFGHCIRRGTAVMMSTAYYHRIDRRNPAAFSPYIIRRILRGDLGFRGVVISDDLADARQVARWRYGARAVKFLGAGGDMVLTVNPAAVPAMYVAVLSRALHDQGFRDLVDTAALRILELKQLRGLL